MSKPLVFFGTENFSAQVLSSLIEAGFAFEAIITKPDRKKGRGKKMSAPAVKNLAIKYNIPVYQPNNTEELINCINKTSCLAGLLVSFGKIIPQSVIDRFKMGIINLHPSLLPKYRGPSPIESSILNGDQTTGVSVMSLSAKMDAGPVYCQQIYSLNGSETSSFLYQELAQLGAELLIDTLPQIINNSLQPKPQNHQLATYCSLLTKNLSHLDPEQKTASQLECQIRAFEVYPKSRYTLFGYNCIIISAKVSDQPDILSIKTKNNQYLNITQLKSPSGKTVSAEDFINGYSQSR